MPRKPRFYLPNIPAHVVQRGNCRQAVFFDDDDYRAYLDWLREGAEKYGCRIHAYVLMTNHVHLLLTPDSRTSISLTIQYVGRQYVSYINRTYGKSGTLWEGRHKGCLVSEQRYFLTCMSYIELNPVRAGMVEHPTDYCWSSYQGNAMGQSDKILTQHAAYLALDANPEGVSRVYRGLVDQSLSSEHVMEVRSCVQTGTPLGNELFRDEVERTLQRKVGQAVRGRPRKGPEKGY